MDRMWSPWRSQHLSDFKREHRPAGSGSVFRRLADLPDEEDERHFVLWRGTHVYVVMNLYPYNNGHLLVVPNREVLRYTDLTDEEQAEVARSIDRSIRWLDVALSPDGYNVGMNEGVAGGAGIPEHLHVHIVPRWSGDTNFMPVTGGVKIIPEAMEDTYRKLRRAVDRETGT